MKLQVDYCCYFKYFKNSYIILLLYIDDMLVAGSSMKHEGDCESQSSFGKEIVNEGCRTREEDT